MAVGTGKLQIGKPHQFAPGESMVDKWPRAEQYTGPGFGRFEGNHKGVEAMGGPDHRRISCHLEPIAPHFAGTAHRKQWQPAPILLAAWFYGPRADGCHSFCRQTMGLTLAITTMQTPGDYTSADADFEIRFGIGQ